MERQANRNKQILPESLTAIRRFRTGRRMLVTGRSHREA